jgi:PAS domain S-box-containing protein
VTGALVGGGLLALAVAGTTVPEPLLRLMDILPLALFACAGAAAATGGVVWIGLRPLGPLAHAMRSAARGEAAQQIEPAGSQTVRHAIDSFNSMLERVQQAQRELEEINRNLEQIVGDRTRELRRSEQKYRSLVGQASEGILLWDPVTLKIVEANARAGELLGTRPRDLLTRTFDSFLTPETRAGARRALQSISRVGAEPPGEVEIVRETGTLNAEVGVSLVRFGEERVVLGILRDVAPRKHLERKAVLLSQQVMEAEKMASIGLLAAGVAHEINNPMGYVVSNVNRLVEYAKRFGELARTGGPPGADRKEINELVGDLHEISHETLEGVERVTEIVRALREFAHGGTQDSAHNWVDLNRVIRNCVTLVHNQMKDRAELELHLEPLPSTRCHSTQIAQVLMNLLQNATHAVEPPGRILLCSYDSGDCVHIAVEDNGVGIDPNDLPHIFEPFFTTKSVGAGMGLGLPVSREIVRRHSGDLVVDSVVGRGTRFLIQLPREGLPHAAE